MQFATKHTCQKKRARDVLSAEPDISARVAFIAIPGNSKAIILNMYVSKGDIILDINPFSYHID